MLLGCSDPSEDGGTVGEDGGTDVGTDAGGVWALVSKVLRERGKKPADE